MLKMSHRALQALPVLLAAAVLAGCATTGGAGGSPEEAVKARAAQLWQARVAGDFQATYRLTPPSYRELTTFEKYRAGFGSSAQITNAEVVGITCETDAKCVAKVKLQAITMFANQRFPLTTHYDDTWVRENGQWWQFQGR